jgi:hypothetical protein
MEKIANEKDLQAHFIRFRIGSVAKKTTTKVIKAKNIIQVP